MSVLRPAPKAKLIMSLFSQQDALIGKALESLCRRFGPTDFIGPLMPFDYTRYYESEFGPGLVRRFVSFQRLVEQDCLVEVKIFACQIEQELGHQGKRRVNIDPGLITAERLVLATGKNFTHRIYLGKGIYADLTLIYQKGRFRPLQWTYPDYASDESLIFWKKVRSFYLDQLKALR